MKRTIFSLLATVALCWSAVAAPNLSGKWTLTLDTPIGPRPIAMEVRQNGETITVKTAKNDKGELTEVAARPTADGFDVAYAFVSHEGGMSGDMKFSVKVAADGTATGTWNFTEYSGPLTGKRTGDADGAPAAPSSLDGAWAGVLDTPVGDRPITFTIKGNKVVLSDPSGATKEVDLVSANGGIKFETEMNSPEAGPGKLVITAKPAGEGTMTGGWSFGEYNGTMKATRAAGSAAPVAAASPINGKWRFEIETPDGARPFSADLSVAGDAVSGKFAKADVAGTFTDNALKLDFLMTVDDINMTDRLKIDGKFDGTKIAGTWKFASYEGPFTAVRIQ